MPIRHQTVATILLLLFTIAAGERLEGFSSLKIAMGVREAGMGGTGVASAHGPQAIAINPAAAAGIARFGVTAAYTKWFLDAHHQSVFAARSLGPTAFGLGVVSFSAGRFEYRDQPTTEPLGEFSPADFSFYLNLAHRLGSKAELGITGRYYYSKIMGYEANGVGFDVGALVRPIRNLTLGASLVDFGRTMSYVRDVFWLPSRLRVGAACDVLALENLRITGTADGCYYIYGNRPGAQVGLEIAWRELAAVRAGYDALSRSNHLNFGLGLRVGLASVDYALSPLGQDLGLAHRFSVGLAARPAK